MSNHSNEERLLVDTIMEMSVGIAGLKLLVIDKGLATEEEMSSYEETAFSLISKACEENMKKTEEDYIKKFGEAAYKEYLEPNLKMARNIVSKEDKND